ncbi:unnamed protein product, partial [Effrenium voratum]
NGCVFESTAGKGQGPMRMELTLRPQMKKNAIIPGMELALQESPPDFERPRHPFDGVE